MFFFCLFCRGGTCHWWVCVVHCSSAPSTPTCCHFATPTADPIAQQTRLQPTCLQRGPRLPRTTGSAGRLQGIPEASVSCGLCYVVTVKLVTECNNTALLQGWHARGPQQAGKKPPSASEGMLRTLEAAVACLPR